jgi:hypothetical protein
MPDPVPELKELKPGDKFELPSGKWATILYHAPNGGTVFYDVPGEGLKHGHPEFQPSAVEHAPEQHSAGDLIPAAGLGVGEHFTYNGVYYEVTSHGGNAIGAKPIGEWAGTGGEAVQFGYSTTLEVADPPDSMLTPNDAHAGTAPAGQLHPGTTIDYFGTKLTITASQPGNVLAVTDQGVAQSIPPDAHVKVLTGQPNPNATLVKLPMGELPLGTAVYGASGSHFGTVVTADADHPGMVAVKPQNDLHPLHYAAESVVTAEQPPVAISDAPTAPDVTPVALKQKKAGALAVGQQVYSYHSEKLLGTVTSVSDKVYIATPDGGETTQGLKSSIKTPAKAAAEAPGPGKVAAGLLHIGDGIQLDSGKVLTVVGFQKGAFDGVGYVLATDDGKPYTTGNGYAFKPNDLLVKATPPPVQTPFGVAGPVQGVPAGLAEYHADTVAEPGQALYAPDGTFIGAFQYDDAAGTVSYIDTGGNPQEWDTSIDTPLIGALPTSTVPGDTLTEAPWQQIKPGDAIYIKDPMGNGELMGTVLSASPQALVVDQSPHGQTTVHEFNANTFYTSSNVPNPAPSSQPPSFKAGDYFTAGGGGIFKMVDSSTAKVVTPSPVPGSPLAGAEVSVPADAESLPPIPDPIGYELPQPGDAEPTYLADVPTGTVFWFKDKAYTKSLQASPEGAVVIHRLSDGAEFNLGFDDTVYQPAGGLSPQDAVGQSQADLFHNLEVGQHFTTAAGGLFQKTSAGKALVIQPLTGADPNGPTPAGAGTESNWGLFNEVQKTDLPQPQAAVSAPVPPSATPTPAAAAQAVTGVPSAPTGSKKGANLVVGEHVFSYHSGKYLGTVTSTSGEKVTIQTPGGQTKELSKKGSVKVAPSSGGATAAVVVPAAATGGAPGAPTAAVTPSGPPPDLPQEAVHPVEYGSIGEGQWVYSGTGHLIGQVTGTNYDDSAGEQLYIKHSSGQIETWTEQEDGALYLPNATPPAATAQGVTNWDAQGLKLKLGGSIGGTQGAVAATDAAGQKYAVKAYQGQQDRVSTEALANAVYRVLGVDAPVGGIATVNGKKAYVAKWTPGAPRKIHKAKDGSALGAGFMADALVANWDVIGAEDDNIIWAADGTPYRVDAGGTFGYRAMGAKKAFGKVPKEVWTMLAPGRQAQRTMLVSEADKMAQAEHIGKVLTDQLIDELVSGAYPGGGVLADTLREALKARVKWMRDFGQGKVTIPGT